MGRERAEGGGEDRQREDVRLLDDLDRLEEYSAAHGGRYDEIGELPASIFEDLWISYVTRKAIDMIETDHRALVTAMYSNGNMSGTDLENAVNGINDMISEHKRMILNPKLAQKEAVSDEGFVTYKWWGDKEDRDAARVHES